MKQGVKESHKLFGVDIEEIVEGFPVSKGDGDTLGACLLSGGNLMEGQDSFEFPVEMFGVDQGFIGQQVAAISAV